MSTIFGPVSPAQKFNKSPSERNSIISEVLLMLVEQPGGHFHPLTGIGGSDRKALWLALPDQHKSTVNGVKKFSRAARRAWTAAFSTSSDRHPSALRVVRGGKREGAGRPKSGKIKLTVHILPETRAALGDKPGEAIDALAATHRAP